MSIESLLKEVNARNKRPIAFVGSDLPPTKYTRLGHHLIDLILLEGRGLPQGTIGCVCGWEGCGKTRILLSAISSALKQHPEKCAVAVAAEAGDYTKERLAEVGIDPNRLIVVRAGHLSSESALQGVLDTLWDEKNKLARNEVCIWTVDSLPALVPEDAQKKSLDEDLVMASNARVFADFFPRVSTWMGDEAIGLVVNQLRPSIGAMGSEKKSHLYGGRAPVQVPKWIVQLTRWGDSAARNRSGDFGEQVQHSMEICIEVMKNNTGIGRTRGSQLSYLVHLAEDETYGLGVSSLECLIRAGQMIGLIEVGGGGWQEVTLDGQKIRATGKQGRVFAQRLIDENLVQALEEAVYDHVQSQQDRTKLKEDDEFEETVLAED